MSQDEGKKSSLTIQWQVTSGLELRIYFKISNQKEVYILSGSRLQMREKRSVPRSYNVQMLPGGNFIVVNAPVFRTLLALNLYSINLGISKAMYRGTES